MLSGVMGMVCFAGAGMSAPQASWEWCGWGGGGFFWAAAWDPSDENTLYMGGDVLGIYKSADKGKTWRIINNGLHDYGVYSLAVAKADPKVVYAMTTDGIARSDNGGELWKRLPESMNNAKALTIARHSTVRGVAVDPRDAMTVYAGSARGEVHKSTDGGETWSQLDFLSALSDEKADGGVKAARGRGYLIMRYSSPANEWGAHGRVEKHLGDGDDWSGFAKLGAKFLAPAGAPRLTAMPVVQSGAGWTWQEGERVDLVPGEWTEATIDLTKVADADDVRLVHLVVWSNGNGFDGDIGIDDVKLMNTGGTPMLPAELVIGDFESPGGADGWRKTGAADGRYAAGVFSSLETSRGRDAVPMAPIAAVVVAENDSKLIFVCHRKMGLFRSADGGATWTRPATPANASHVAVSTKDPRVVYGAFDRDGIWKSADAGVTWAKAPGAVPAGYAALEVVVDPRDADVAHVIVTGNWSGMYGVTRDGGKTFAFGQGWKRDADSNRTFAGHDRGGGDLSTPTNIAMSPTNPDRLFISANWTNIMSEDGGRTWLQRDTGADITCFHDIKFAGGSVFATAMDEGLFRSDDNGATWHHLAPRQWEAGLSGHQWKVLAWPKGDTFRMVSTVSPWYHDREFPNFVLISEDGGATFKRGTAGLPDYVSRSHTMWERAYARALVADPADPDVLWLGMDGAPEGEGRNGGGVFKSVDGGYTWKQLANQPGSRCVFYGLAVDPTNPERIFWGAGDQGNKTGVFGVWVSDDGGDSWRKAPEVNEWIFNIEVSPKGVAYAGGSSHLWRSADGGKTWRMNPYKFRGQTVVGIAVDPADGNRLWVSSTSWGGSDSGGIYESRDAGETWADITGDIPYRKPLVLRYNAAKKELWAAGVGAWKLKIEN